MDDLWMNGLMEGWMDDRGMGGRKLRGQTKDGQRYID